jgi:hypothetical protein
MVVILLSFSIAIVKNEPGGSFAKKQEKLGGGCLNFTGVKISFMRGRETVHVATPNANR